MTDNLAPAELVDAVTSGDDVAVERLLELSGEPELASAYTEDGWSLLHLAPSRAIAELLLEHGADIEARNRHKVFGPGNRPLHAAVYMDKPDVVDALIAAGADVNSADDSGWTALHTAVSHGRVGLSRRLLEAGAEVDARTGRVEGKEWSNCTALELLHVWDRTGDGHEPMPEDVKAELYRLLKDHGATTVRLTDFG
jgi:ankyrin repeat protein